jgi:hypothetical protein
MEKVKITLIGLPEINGSALIQTSLIEFEDGKKEVVSDSVERMDLDAKKPISISLYEYLKSKHNIK